MAEKTKKLTIGSLSPAKKAELKEALLTDVYSSSLSAAIAATLTSLALLFLTKMANPAANVLPPLIASVPLLLIEVLLLPIARAKISSYRTRYVLATIGWSLPGAVFGAFFIYYLRDIRDVTAVSLLVFTAMFLPFTLSIMFASSKLIHRLFTLFYGTPTAIYLLFYRYELDMMAVAVFLFIVVLPAVIWMNKIGYDKRVSFLLMEFALREEKEQAEKTMVDLRETQKKELIQTEKLSTLGQLVASVGHDINNPMNYISGAQQNLKRHVESLSKLLRKMTEGDPAAAEVAADFEQRFGKMGTALDDIHTGVKRVAEINGALRSYVRKDSEVRKDVSLAKVIKDSLIILRSKLKDFKVDTAIDELPPITCHPSQLGQVFTNLLVNAADAIQERAGQQKVNGKEFTGQIVVNASSQSREQVGGINVEVEDNGNGIPPELKDRVAEAFFTTKPEDKGTGLGLDICKKIISEHGGVMEIADSTNLSGAKFSVWLPLEPKEV